MPVTLDRPGRPFLMPERRAVMWRAVDPAHPDTAIGIGVELAALAALAGRPTLDGERAAQAFAEFVVDIEASASARFDAGPPDQRIIILTTDDLAEPIARARLRRVMKRVARRGALPKPR